MYEDLIERVKELTERLTHVRTVFDLDGKRDQLAKLEKVMAKPGFWDNQEQARETVTELKTLKAVIDPWTEEAAALEDAGILLEVADEEGDESARSELEIEVADLEHRVDGLEFKSTMADPADALNCYLSIHAGAGGTDACDWAEMMLRLYSRYAERNDFEVELIDRMASEEAGIRRATLLVKGAYATGYLRAEIGVHRLVRLSPFDAAHRRQTSFASVDVVPEVKDADIEVNEADLKIDTFRAGGAGGQHVNVTDSAVRITHLPTGVVSQCQNERSQHKNKKQAMNLLKAKLYQIREQEKRDELKKMYGEKGEIAWGYQIRSYVLHPYKQVKDLRTGLESSNVDRVLDGEIDDFIEAYLRSRIGGDQK
ncbi:MAG: peptide chain release factor 2 [Planctomycetota bacterium]